MKKIIWSNRALNTYEDCIIDILDKWPIDIAERFEQLTNELLDRLKTQNKLCPPSKQKKLRKCVIHENVSLIYQIKNNAIELVTFVDNRDNHKY